MGLFNSLFGDGTRSTGAAPHELYRKGVELYRSSGATAEVACLMQKAGDGGNGQAWAFLGYQYQEGEGVSRDIAKAIDCYKRSADLKCGIGLYNLGSAYDNGVGVDRDKETAFEYFQKAADVGHSEGLNTVGDWYFNGVVVRRDHEEAVRNFKAAFALGNGEAAFRLAHCLDYGQGIDANREKAAALYSIAARLGCDQARGRAMFSMPSQSMVQEILKGNARLLEASMLGSAERIRELIRFDGEDVDSSINPDGDTLLTRSIMHGNSALAMDLMRMGADANIPLHNGRTALMTAAGIGDVSLVRSLLDAGAKIDWRKSGGNTALMYAVSKHQEAAASVLLSAGADAKMRDDEGMDAKDYARSFAPELLRLFS